MRRQARIILRLADEIFKPMLIQALVIGALIESARGCHMRISVTCPSCGAPPATGASRCPYCGAAVKQPSTRQQHESRIAELRLVLGRRKPTLDEALEMGGHHLALGQNAHAEHYLRQAIELDPEAPRPRLLLCLALLGFNQPVVSSQTYREEIESQFDWLQRNRSGAPEVEWLGHYLELEHSMRRGDWQSGIGQGRIAVEKFPDNYLLQFMCGLALIHFGQTDGLTRGDFREALRRIRMSVELNPEFEPAVKNVRVLEDLAARAPA